MPAHDRRSLCRHRPIHSLLTIAFTFAITLSIATGATAADPAPPILSVEMDIPAAKAVARLKKQLKNRGFTVVKEINLLSNLKKNLGKKLGDKFNRQKLTAVRSLVVCHGRYANRIANTDPAMLALCPLTLAAVEKDGKTTVHFRRPTVGFTSTAAIKTLTDVERDIAAALHAAKAGPKMK